MSSSTVLIHMLSTDVEDFFAFVIFLCFQVVFENLLRKVSGQAPITLLGPKYVLEKKKLYRSSTCSTDSY